MNWCRRRWGSQTGRLQQAAVQLLAKKRLAQDTAETMMAQEAVVTVQDAETVVVQEAAVTVQATETMTMQEAASDASVRKVAIENRD